MNYYKVEEIYFDVHFIALSLYYECVVVDCVVVNCGLNSCLSVNCLIPCVSKVDLITHYISSPHISYLQLCLVLSS